jgi:hypothetical protein
VEARAVKLATMEGERTRPAVPSHRESTATESATAESPAHGARAHAATMRGHTTTVATTAVSATTVATTAVSATAVSTAAVSAAATTRRRNGWGKRNRRTDCNGGGKSHDALSEHDSASLVPSPPRRS